jgi:hypothetical protein
MLPKNRSMTVEDAHGIYEFLGIPKIEDLLSNTTPAGSDYKPAGTE